MNTQKHHRRDKLQKSSMLFLQLGLVLALFFVYTALEYESLKNDPFVFNDDPNEPDIEIASDVIFILEKPTKEPVLKIVPTKSFTNFKKNEDDQPTPEEVFEPKEPEVGIDTQIDALPGDNTPLDDDEPQPFITVESIPVYPGCEGLEKEDSIACFSKNIAMFVNKKFNTEIAENLNLSGKHKIWVQFTVDKKGLVTDIKARSPHKKLELEAIKVTKALPQMTPGMQRTKPVNVKYIMPIIFQVY